jgi:hypothetical protein
VRGQEARDFAQILLFMGYVGEGDSAKAVAKELRLEYVQVTSKDEDPGAAALVERGLR